ncbi:glycosyltransferase [Geomonas sp. RF6]|uniref:glycosyltransferase family 2 protein n=1 Tax=Geomonas sp. RF6 TaxID=2897342 RepID=UPI001E537C63|nr:glycosyltransferase family 2 protein [Geomonas sp. RF6]UFS72691.1 glycosyltransferase [Geomonas sp. RF6]
MSTSAGALRAADPDTSATGEPEPAPALRVSVIIPVKPGGAVRALERLAVATYPADRFEVLVAYGTRPSAQRNLAARQAGGEILFFLDDDSQVSPVFLQRALEHFRDPRVAAVGGPSLTPSTDSPIQRAIGAAFACRFGGGGVRNRYRCAGEARHTGDHELILCNLAFRRDTFLALGGLDERLYPNEENELMERLVHGGHLLVHDPELAVHRSQRPNYRAFVRQMYGYGRGRGEQTLLTGRVKPSAMAPAFFLLYLLAAPFFLTGIWFAPALLYFAGCLAAAAVVSRGELALFWRLIGVFPTLHLLYGAGIWRGLFTPRFRKAAGEAPPVEVRTVKPFGAEIKG